MTRRYSLVVEVYFDEADDESALATALAFVGGAPLPGGDSDIEPVCLLELLETPEGDDADPRTVTDF